MICFGTKSELYDVLAACTCKRSIISKKLQTHQSIPCGRNHPDKKIEYMLRIATKKLANTLLDTFYKNVGFKTMMK